jgi:hypothetical protein
MIRDFVTFLADHALEIASLLVSAAALVYAALALQAARHAIQIARDSDLAALRLRAHNELSAAQRSLYKLQEACNLTRQQWERHLEKHYPPLGRGFNQPKETQHIREIERKGTTLLQLLKDDTPTTTISSAAELERFVKHAQDTAMRIEQLSFDLTAPKPIGI